MAIRAPASYNSITSYDWRLFQPRANVLTTQPSMVTDDQERALRTDHIFLNDMFWTWYDDPNFFKDVRRYKLRAKDICNSGNVVVACNCYSWSWMDATTTSYNIRVTDGATTLTTNLTNIIPSWQSLGSVNWITNNTEIEIVCSANRVGSDNVYVGGFAFVGTGI